jgi:hypothetical protein
VECHLSLSGKIGAEGAIVRLRLCGILIFAALAAIAAPAVAQQTPLPPELHPWGRFEPGAWKSVRVVTESLNEQGAIVSISTSEVKTTLLAIDDDDVTLEIQTCMEVAGKRFKAETQTVRQGFHGEPIGPMPAVKEPVDAQVVVEARKLACKLLQLELVGPNEKTVVQMFYLPGNSPRLLRRLATTTDVEGKQTLRESTVETIALDMPIRVRGQTFTGSYVKTVGAGPGGGTTSIAAIVPDVPGGVVAHSSKEFDKTGRVVRRTTLELVDFDQEPEKDRSNSFNRKRDKRRAKAVSRHGQ